MMISQSVTKLKLHTYLNFDVDDRGNENGRTWGMALEHGTFSLNLLTAKFRLHLNAERKTLALRQQKKRAASYAERAMNEFLCVAVSSIALA